MVTNNSLPSLGIFATPARGRASSRDTAAPGKKPQNLPKGRLCVFFALGWNRTNINGLEVRRTIHCATRAAAHCAILAVQTNTVNAALLARIGNRCRWICFHILECFLSRRKLRYDRIQRGAIKCSSRKCRLRRCPQVIEDAEEHHDPPQNGASDRKECESQKRSPVGGGERTQTFRFTTLGVDITDVI